MATPLRSMSEILPAGTRLVYQWGYLLDDLPEEIGGGFVSGEFILRSDGALLERGVTDSYSKGATTWEAGPWTVYQQFPPGTSEGQVRAWLRAKHYQLGGPTPVPVDQDSSGPFPGLPEKAVIQAMLAKDRGRGA